MIFDKSITIMNTETDTLLILLNIISSFVLLIAC